MVELLLSFVAGLAFGWIIMPRSNGRRFKNAPEPLDYTRID